MTTTLLNNLKVIIIGGSIGGLSCGLELLKHGASVKIFERSAFTLESRGAGLGTVPHLVNRFRSHNEKEINKDWDNMDIFLQQEGVHFNTFEGVDQHQRFVILMIYVYLFQIWK
jgi:2-polyprenyl-6-methoxyphenol hydroxylase-like FAD-dependent oxidoreductase